MRWSEAIRATALASVLLASRMVAQTKKNEPEFTRQSLLVINFAPGEGADLRSGRRAADVVRSRTGKLINKHEVELIDPADVAKALDRAGYDADSMFAISGIIPLARKMRADEIVIGRVSTSAAATRISGELVLTRDERLRQPLIEVSAPRLDSAATLFAHALVAARAQLIPQRRCENALHDGNGLRAVAAAREGVAAYSRSTIARSCLVWSLHQTKAPASDVLAVAEQILAIDSNNVHAIEYAAISLDSLRQRDSAATMWLRFARTDSANVDLALRVTYALYDGGNARRAEPFVVRVSDAHPDNLPLLRQKWRVAYENKSWTHAIEAGEAMMKLDADARADSTFHLRLGTAYRSANLPLKAVATLATAVSAFPKDARLYSLYAQMIRAESDTVVPRGLALFPSSADLAVMNARDLRARGKIAESLDATKRAVALDSTLAQGRLMVAQLEIELGRPDSALASLRSALGAGEDSSLVAQFALAKGNALYRAAGSTKTSADFALALRFLGFADSVHSTTASRFLDGVATLSYSQTLLTEAAKLSDRSQACRLMRTGADLVPVAKAAIEAGKEGFLEAAEQSLRAVGELESYVGQALASCAPPSRDNHD